MQRDVDGILRETLDCYDDGAIEKMAAEGQNSPVDLLLTPESGLLVQAHAAGVTRGVTSPVLAAAVPAEYREAEGHWYALTRRARIVYASKERVKQTALNYEDYGSPGLNHKICIRSGQHYYNTALFAAYIVKHGEAQAETWLMPLSRREGYGSVSEFLNAARTRQDGKLTAAIADALVSAETRFFRDKPTFERLRTDILPALAKRRASLPIFGNV